MNIVTMFARATLLFVQREMYESIVYHVIVIESGTHPPIAETPDGVGLGLAALFDLRAWGAVSFANNPGEWSLETPW